MILSILVFLLNLTSPDSLLNQYKRVAENNVTTLLGAGELRQMDKISGHEYYLFDSENSNKGAIVVFSSAKGRFEYFDYMIIISSTVEIMDIKILKYRSEYGYEISNKGWLKQFYHKPSGRFEYRKNIDAQSGATFSAQSLVTDINLILDYLKK